jgi:hypothetical protein
VYISLLAPCLRCEESQPASKAIERAGWTVYQTVCHGTRYCDQTRTRGIFGQRKSPLI